MDTRPPDPEDEWERIYDAARYRRPCDALGMTKEQVNSALWMTGLDSRDLDSLEPTAPVRQDVFHWLTHSGCYLDPATMMHPDAERRIYVGISPDIYQFLREKRASQGRDPEDWPEPCDNVEAIYKVTMTRGWMVRLFTKDRASLISYLPDVWRDLMAEYKATKALGPRPVADGDIEAALPEIEELASYVRPEVRRIPVLVPSEPWGQLTFITVWFKMDRVRVLGRLARYAPPAHGHGLAPRSPAVAHRCQDVPEVPSAPGLI